MSPKSAGNQEVEQVRTYKIFGVVISDDLKWNAYIEHVIAKVAKRLYALRFCQRTCSRYIPV